MTDTATPERTAPPSSETLAAILAHLEATEHGPGQYGLTEVVTTGTHRAAVRRRLTTIAVAVWILAGIQIAGIAYGAYIYSQVHHSASSAQSYTDCLHDDTKSADDCAALG